MKLNTGHKRKLKIQYFGWTLFLGIVLFSYIFPYLQPTSKYQTNSQEILLGPSYLHWFGTDSLGRDLFFRSLLGVQNTLQVGLMAAIVALTLGVLVGSVSGMIHPLGDSIIMRCVDLFIALPQLVLVTLWTIFFKSLFPSEKYFYLALPLAIGVSSWMIYAKVIRNSFLKEKNLIYVQNAKAIGSPFFHTMYYHIFPNVLQIAISTLILQIPHYLFFESFLSFIGQGFSAQQVSLGTLIQNGWVHLTFSPHLIIFPSFILFLLSMPFYFIIFTKNSDNSYRTRR